MTDLIMISNKYVLITPARNEEKYIGRTIESVLNQTIKPERWIIVSDGSTDRTDEIVMKYSEKNNFITFRKTTDEPERNFGSKVLAFNFGYEALKEINYDFIGNLDADIVFNEDYYEKILDKFRENPQLGIAGGIRLDYNNGKFININTSRNSVAGGFQLFSRSCFETIGGYRPMKFGGIDAVAETMARMKGWKVESFEDIKLYHYKPTGTANKNIIRYKFRNGIKHYLIGYHPVFCLLRFISNFSKRPFIIGTISSIAGYLWSYIKRYDRPVPPEFVKYLRHEQTYRLRTLFKLGKDPESRNSGELKSLAK